MIALETLKHSWYFTEITLKAWDILFHEGEENEYVYVIYDGELSIQKSISSARESFRILSLLWVWNIIWEGSLSQNNPKEVQIIAARSTSLLAIHAKNDFPKFLKAYPEEAYSLLLHIIDLANTRLLRANRELTANYEVSCAIADIGRIDMKGIVKLLQVFQSIVQADALLYFEANIALDQYYKLKYHSWEKEKMQNHILKFEKNIFSYEVLTQEDIFIVWYSRFTPLLLGEKNHGFLVVCREKKDFNENEEKLLQNIATSFVWVIQQKILLEEQKNKLYIKDSSPGL